MPIVIVEGAAGRCPAPSAGRTYPSGIASPEGSSVRATAGQGSRVHARAQEPGAVVCPPRRTVRVGRVGRVVLPPSGDPSLDVVGDPRRRPGQRRPRQAARLDRLGDALPVATLPSGRADDQKHIEGIVAYVATGLNSGRSEGLNGKIRTITRRSFGFHSASSLIALITLCCARYLSQFVSR